MKNKFALVLFVSSVLSNTFHSHNHGYRLGHYVNSHGYIPAHVQEQNHGHSHSHGYIPAHAQEHDHGHSHSHGYIPAHSQEHKYGHSHSPHYVHRPNYVQRPKNLQSSHVNRGTYFMNIVFNLKQRLIVAENRSLTTETDLIEFTKAYMERKIFINTELNYLRNKINQFIQANNDLSTSLIAKNTQDITDLQTEQSTQNSMITDIANDVQELQNLVKICPGASLAVNDLCYLVVTTERNHQAATDDCNTNGGYLVEPPPSNIGVGELLTELVKLFPNEIATIAGQARKVLWTGGVTLAAPPDTMKYVHKGLIILKNDPFFLNNLGTTQVAVMPLVMPDASFFRGDDPTLTNAYVCEYEKVLPVK